jgi:hypothetical protein
LNSPGDSKSPGEFKLIPALAKLEPLDLIPMQGWMSSNLLKRMIVGKSPKIPRATPDLSLPMGDKLPSATSAEWLMN